MNLDYYKIDNQRKICENLDENKCSLNPHCKFHNGKCSFALTQEYLLEFIKKYDESQIIYFSNKNYIMGKQFSNDLKLKAVNHYNKTNNYVQTCEIFECSERSLKRWTERYKKNTLDRIPRKQGSYKIKKEHVKYIKEILKNKNNIHIKSVHELLKIKFPELKISRQYIHDLIRNNNITRKRATHEHFPKTYRGKPRDENLELKEFFSEISKLYSKVQ